MAAEIGFGNGEEVAKLRQQRAALAEFGSHALRSRDLDALLQEASGRISGACGVELVKVMEILPGGERMLVRAGVNWRPGVVGHETLAAHSGSPGGYALETGAPVVSHDTASEDRFAIPDILVEHGVKSMVNVLIAGERGPWGVLEIDARDRRDFDEDDIAFLQNYANLLAAAIERHQRQHELAEALERGRMLQAELQHRSRNLLANIEALAKRTLASSADLLGFGEAFSARLAALGRSQELLAPGSSAPVSLRTILVQELDAHGAEIGDRASIGGPDVALAPAIAQALGMGFHELATNASKHGALGRDEGHLEVTWRVGGSDEQPEIAIRWRETGVPIEAPPVRRGIGSDTVERSLPRLLEGSASMTYHPDGLECEIRFPLPAAGSSRRAPGGAAG